MIKIQKDITPIKDIVTQFKSVVLATLYNEGTPYLSYAPFVRFQEKYYILVSEMAEHTKNIKVNDNLGLLFVEDESKAFAGTILSIIPLVVMYGIIQKYFIESIDRSGITGE